MFNTEELNTLDRKYFNVIAAGEYDVTVMSRNTGHYWYIHDPDCEDRRVLALFHRHYGGAVPYHFQRHEPTLRSAVRYIRKHDIFQMNGRKW